METNPGTGDGTEEVVDSTEVAELDIATADIDELLAEHEARKAEVDELMGMPVSLAQQADLAAAITDLNEVAHAINAIRSAVVPPIVDIPDEPVAVDDTSEPETAETDETETEAETSVVDETDAPVIEVTDAATTVAPIAHADVDEEEIADEAATDTVAEPTEPDVALPAEAPAEAETAPVADAPEATEPVAETVEEATPVATEPVTPEGEPANIEHGDAITAQTPEDTTVDTPLNQTGDSPEPTNADSAVVEAAQNILMSGDLVGAHVAGVGDDERPNGPMGQSRLPVVEYEAGGGQTKFSQGRKLSFADIGEAMQSIKSRRATPGSGPQDGIIASISAFEDLSDLSVDVLNGDRTPAQNSALMRETAENFGAKRLGRAPRTAAICDPLDILREIPQCGEVDTPFADSFPQRPISRLGFQFIPAMSAIAVDDGVAVWTEDDQAAIDDDDSSTWKPVVDIECADPIPARAEEITVGARVDTSTSLSQPEHVEEFIHKLRVQRARRREQYLLGQFDDLAGGYTFEANYGAVAGLVEAVASLMPSLLYGERLDQADYDLVLEPGHREKLVLDEVSREFGDTAQQRWMNIKAMLTDLLGVGKIIVLRDLKTGTLNAPRAQGTSGALARLRDVNRVRLNPAAAFLYGATGEEATGWQTDPQLVRQNRTQFFSTEWILLAKHGCHPAAWIDLTSCGNGSRAAGIEPVDCTTQGS